MSEHLGFLMEGGGREGRKEGTANGSLANIHMHTPMVRSWFGRHVDVTRFQAIPHMLRDNLSGFPLNRNRCSASPTV